MIKDKNRILYILFAIDILIPVFFAIIPLIRDLDIGSLMFSLIYNIPTIIMLLSLLYWVPDKYNNLSIVALIGNIFLTILFWFSTIGSNELGILFGLLVGLLFNIIYCVICVIISLLLKISTKK